MARRARDSRSHRNHSLSEPAQAAARVLSTGCHVYAIPLLAVAGSLARKKPTSVEPDPAEMAERYGAETTCQTGATS